MTLETEYTIVYAMTERVNNALFMRTPRTEADDVEPRVVTDWIEF